jgi:ketosteroid isomerase-like protein
MPSENVQIAQQAIAAFNRVDVGLFASFTTPDFEWSPSMVAVEGEVFRGREGVERYFASLGAAWDAFVIVDDGFRDLHDVVVMLGGLQGRGRGSGVPVDAALGMVFDFRDAKISRIRGFLDHAEALRAAGVSE